MPSCTLFDVGPAFEFMSPWSLAKRFLQAEAVVVVLVACKATWVDAAGGGYEVVAEWEDAPLALIWPDSVVEHQERRVAKTSATAPIDPRLAALAATAKADRAVATFRRTPGADYKFDPCKWASPRPPVPQGTLSVLCQGQVR